MGNNIAGRLRITWCEPLLDEGGSNVGEVKTAADCLPTSEYQGVKDVMKTKTSLFLAVCVAGILTGVCVGAWGQDFKGFPDVPKNHWAAQAVNDLAQRGILQGYPAEAAGGKLRTKPQTQQTAPTPIPTKKSTGGASARPRK